MDEMVLTRLGRRRALDRAMDAAMKQKTRRRRKADGIVSLSFHGVTMCSNGGRISNKWPTPKLKICVDA